MEYFGDAVKDAVSRPHVRGAYSTATRITRSIPGSTASSTYNLNEHKADPNNPGVGRSNQPRTSVYCRPPIAFVLRLRSPDDRGVLGGEACSDRRGGGLSSNASYVFAGDMNGDGGCRTI